MKKLFVHYLILPLFLLLTACAGQWQDRWYTGGESSEGSISVYRSPADQRDYRYLQLPNDMKVLLISDPETDKAAASLNVNVGSFQNPADRDGLAHFLEHMLFLGTQKYPEAGGYQKFISEHGGMHNAYTSLEQTNYFFDVNADYLQPTLDRFAQFFIAPLFDSAYVDREQHAVESEYRLKIKDDNAREWDVLREVVNPLHPLSKFTVGSLDTLADRKNDRVREDLLAFYQRYYSADIMTLVVLGKESLDELENWVKPLFSAVPDRDVSIPAKSIPLFEDGLPKLVRAQPVTEKRALDILFPMPSVGGYWQTKPADFLGYLIGDESEGSLVQVLKSQGLVEGLGAGMAYDSRAGAAFNITIELTPQGVEQYQQVLDELFAWLALVRREGITRWRYREMSELRKIDFHFQEKGPPLQYVQTVSVLMQQMPPQEILRGVYVMDEFKRPLLSRYADYLKANNALIMLVAPGLPTDRVTERYNVPYAVTTVDEAQAKAWQRVRAGDAYALAPKNPYIPTRFDVPGKAGGTAVPKLLARSSQSSLWYHLDDKFLTPKAQFQALITTPAVKTAAGTAMTELYLALVRDQLNAEIYPASLAGLKFQVGLWDAGISVELNGYNHRQPILLQRVLASLAKPAWDAAQFERVKAMLIREWRNSTQAWPARQAFAELPALLRGSPRAIELADALAPVTEAQLRAFVEGIYRYGHGTFYVGGNLARDEARNMVAKTLAVLGLGESGDTDMPYRVLQLPASPVLPEQRLAVAHDDTAAVLYIQGRDDSLKERALVALIQGVTEAPFYTRLRTEQQLGYLVGSTIAPMNRVPGLAYYLQSPVAGPDKLRQAVHGFLREFQTQVATLSEEAFARHQASLLATIEEAPKNLGELAARHRESLLLDYHQFDFRERLANAVRAISLDEFRKAYRDILLNESGVRGLWVSADNALTESAINIGSNEYYEYPQ